MGDCYRQRQQRTTTTIQLRVTTQTSMLCIFIITSYSDVYTNYSCVCNILREDSSADCYQLSFTSMRLACTFQTALPVVQIPKLFELTEFVLHSPNHQPLPPAQVPPEQMSLSLSGVLNILPLAFQFGACAAAIALPASPLYPATVSRYLPTSSLMENVEYSAEYHRPEVRWIYSQTHVTAGVLTASNSLLLGKITVCSFAFQQCKLFLYFSVEQSNIVPQWSRIRQQLLALAKTNTMQHGDDGAKLGCTTLPTNMVGLLAADILHCYMYMVCEMPAQEMWDITSLASNSSHLVRPVVHTSPFHCTCHQSATVLLNLRHS